MGFEPLSSLELQAEENKSKNDLFMTFIYQQNARQALKEMQIVRFGNNLVIAIYRPDLKKNPVPRGSFGDVYIAYPIQIEIILENGIEVMRCKPSRGKISTIKAQYIQQAQQPIIDESRADQYLFSARLSRMPRKEQGADGQIVYEMVTIMSKVPGVPLSALYKQRCFARLTAEQRIRLAISVIHAYQKLHAEQFFHGDIKAENTMIDLDTLEAIPIDLGFSYTPLTCAPENLDVEGEPCLKETPTPQSDVYSLAIDILSIIFSGIRWSTGMTRESFQKERNRMIRFNFLTISISFSGVKIGYESAEIIKMLDGMLSQNPKNRITLENAEKILEEKLESLTGTTDVCISEDDWAERQKHAMKLRALDLVLSDPKYKIDKQYVMNDSTFEVDCYDQNDPNAMISELEIYCAQLAADIIKDASANIHCIDMGKVDDYNNFQKSIAELKGEKYYFLVKIGKNDTKVTDVKVLACKSDSFDHHLADVVCDKYNPNHILVETLNHLRIGQEKKQPANDSFLNSKDTFFVSGAEPNPNEYTPLINPRHIISI